MSDIFHEVQEDLRRDRMKALWDRYGSFVIVVAAFVVLGVGGWRGYEYVQARAAAEAGDKYQAASKLAADGKADDARKAFAQLSTDAPAGYVQLAKLREADEAAKTDKAAALKLYQSMAGDAGGDPVLRDAARLRGAYLAADVGTLDQTRALADPLAAVNGPFSSLAREAIGLAAYKGGDVAETRRQFEAIVGDAEAPGSLRQRADLMLAVLPPADGADAAKQTN